MDWFFKLTSTINRCQLDTNEMFGLIVAAFAFHFVVKSVVILMFIYLLPHPLSHYCPSSHRLITCFAHSEISAHLSLRCGKHLALSHIFNIKVHTYLHNQEIFLVPRCVLITRVLLYAYVHIYIHKQA